MKIAVNTMFKNEEKLLSEILKTWIKYPVDLFVFYDDNSNDSSCDVIKKFLTKDRFIIVNDKLEKFNESYQRQKMLDISNQNDIDVVLSLDCDELLSSNILKNWESFIGAYETKNVHLFWYNLVNNTFTKYRSDPAYSSNYRSFVLPLKYTGKLNLNDWKYHTPRVPNINLPVYKTDQCGILHLQAINRRFYAIKQLWYKHYEYVHYKHSVEYINSRYDSVVNNLYFNEKQIDSKLIEDITFDIDIFNQLERDKGYLDFVLKNYNKDLVTFGREYL